MYNYDNAAADVKARRTMRAGKKAKKAVNNASPMQMAMEKGIRKAMKMDK
jgi:hypothetical protein